MSLLMMAEEGKLLNSELRQLVDMVENLDLLHTFSPVIKHLGNLLTHSTSLQSDPSARRLSSQLPEDREKKIAEFLNAVAPFFPHLVCHIIEMVWMKNRESFPLLIQPQLTSAWERLSALFRLKQSLSDDRRHDSDLRVKPEQ